MFKEFTPSKLQMSGFIHLMPQATQPGELDHGPQGPGTPDDPSGPAQDFWGVPRADTQRARKSSPKAAGQEGRAGL